MADGVEHIESSNEAFDPNALILSSSKAERQKLSASEPKATKKKPNKRMLRNIKKLQKKVSTDASIKASLIELNNYRISPDVASQLKSSVSHCRNPKRRRISFSEWVAPVEAAERIEVQETLASERTDEDISHNAPKELESDGFSDTAEETLVSTITTELSQKELDKDAFIENIRRRRLEEDNVIDDASRILTKDEHKLFQKIPTLNRSIEIQRFRASLPAACMEHDIVESVISNDIVLITGDTGCGKSTQVPQFLYDAGFCLNSKLRIGITQPRRLAALAVAARVTEELGDPDIVGYQVRYDKSVGPNCRLKFMTDGILLRELQSDFLCRYDRRKHIILFSAYSVIILDEAHERSINCDILIGLLSRCVALRRRRYEAASNNSSCIPLPPLRLVIMSATLRLSDFTENPNLFSPPPPVIHIPAKTHPVTLHFLRKTPAGKCIKPAAMKAVQIHQNLPPGSVLVFVTGRREVLATCREIRRRLSPKDDGNSSESDSSNASSNCLSDGDDESKLEEDELEVINLKPVLTVKTNIKPSNEHPAAEVIEKDELINAAFNLEGDEDETQIVRLIQGEVSERNNPENPKVPTIESSTKIEEDQDAAALGFDSGNATGQLNPKAALADFKGWLGSDATVDCNVKVLPLFARLSQKEQMGAFEIPQPGERVIIVATNVAETSVTLPNIRYVVDAGKEKQRRFTNGDAASIFMTHWISKASANQRAGRAGRVGPGHCYRLYSSAMYTYIFKDHPTVNLFLTPLDSVVLFMASLGISSLQSFPFPTPPPSVASQKAENNLISLGALKKNNTEHCKITPLGRLMSQFPVPPRFAKVLVATAAQSLSSSKSLASLLPAVCAGVVAGLTVGGLLEDDMPNKEVGVQHNESKNPAWVNFESDLDVINYLVLGYISADNKEDFCYKNKANQKQLQETSSLAVQLLHSMSIRFPKLGKLEFLPPGKSKTISNKLSIAMHDCFLIGFIDNIAIRGDLLNPPVKSTTTYFWTDRANETAQGRDAKLYIHNFSQLHKLRPRPSLVAFGQMITSNDYDKPKRFLKECFPVDPVALARIDSPLVDNAMFLQTPLPSYSIVNDTVDAFTLAKYIPMDFALPTILKPLGESYQARYQVFASAFLSGDVFDELKEFVSYWKYPPNIFMQSLEFNESQENVRYIPVPLKGFLHELQSKKCASKKMFLNILSIEDPKYLLEAVGALLKSSTSKSKIKELKALWMTQFHSRYGIRHEN